ncbi:MAG: HD domain-containing protein [Flavobacteriales bacterium]|nr:HD domain-containing protein [Flavobacteriales bacterium]MBT5089532.1 HD domain-containing protein [Flavobacteriales bacterium]
MNYTSALNNPIFKTIQLASDELNYPTYVVGGWVRDLLLERKQEKTDIDFVCIGSGIKLAKKVNSLIGNKATLKVFKNFGTAMINYKGENYEFVGARKESYRSESRKPIVENGTLEDDQNRRDFTINAMAIQLNANSYGALIDPFDGKKDLKNKIIRTPLNPDITYSDDPLRMMRAVRFASQLDFLIEEQSLKSITDNAERLSIISQERITEELNKIILTSIPSKGFKLLFNTQLLHQFFPIMCKLQGVELIGKHGHKDNFYHTLEVLDNISKNTNNVWLRWAAILHDIAKPQTKKYEEGHGWTFHAHEFLGGKLVPKIFRELKLPLNEKMKYVQKLVTLHLRPIILAKDIVTDSAIRRLLFDAADDIDDLMTLCDADITSKNEKKVKKYLKNFQLVRSKLKEVEEKDQIRNFQPPVDGKEIMDLFSIKPGREIGILKNAIKDAILDGTVKNDKEQALAFIIKKAKELNLQPVK